MQMQHERRLLLRDQVIAVLQVTDEALQELVDTRQILPIRIVGVERFDSKDVLQLIDTYRATAMRRAA